MRAIARLGWASKMATYLKWNYRLLGNFCGGDFHAAILPSTLVADWFRSCRVASLWCLSFATDGRDSVSYTHLTLPTTERV